MLDIGGNSEEFAMQICRRCAQVFAGIADLTVVCHVGKEHVQNARLTARIGFRVFDLAGDVILSGFVVITSKSLLHDWPDENASDLLTHSFAPLPLNGAVVVFERRVWDVTEYPLTFRQLPVVLFLQSYRSPEFYQHELDRVGFTDVKVTQFVLRVPLIMLIGWNSV